MTLDFNLIVLLPALASILMIATASVEAALLGVYLPLLLVLPDTYYWGWPQLNFHEFAILPIGIVLSWWVVNGLWRWSWIDAAVVAFVGWTILCDLHASGTSSIADHIINPLALALFPYMAGKLLIEQKGIRVSVARRFVFLLFVDAIICLYEFRFASNPYRRFLGGLLSGTEGWFTQLRYGFARVAGPFGHAIFMGAMVAIAILLHLYLVHFGLWERRFRWLPDWRLNKQWTILCGLVVGSLMTLSRGPWLAVIVGIVVGSIGTAVDRPRALKRAVAVLALGGGLMYLGFKAYVAGAEQYSSQEELGSALYRTDLLNEYQEIAMQQRVWGWGSSDWPKVQGMASVDNWYLLLTLMYGIPGLVLFLIMVVLTVARLLWVGMSDAYLPADDRALLFTMSSIITSIAVAVSTVYLGGQLSPLLFLMLGWSDGCLAYRPSRRLALSSAFQFQKVIA